MVKADSLIKLNKDKWLIRLLALSAPLFSLRLYESISLFDIFTLVAVLIFPFSFRLKTVLLFLIFAVFVIVSDLNGFFFIGGNLDNLAESINIFCRYIILLFVMPYLSYKLFYQDNESQSRIDLFYQLLIASFFCVLIFNVYAIYYQVEDYFLFQRFCSIYGNPNTAALVFNIMTVICLFNIGNKTRWVSLVSYASLPLILSSLVFTGSFSGFLIESIILSGFIIKTINFRVSVIVFGLLFGVISVDLSFIDRDSQLLRGYDRFNQLVEIITDFDDVEIIEIGSAGERLTSIRMSVNEIILSPSYIFSGIGFGHVNDLVYSRTGYTGSIHFVYLQMIISIGIIATAIYLYIFLRILNKIPRYFAGTNFAHQGAVIIGVFLILGIFIPHTYMSFYFAPVFPFLGLYGVKNELA